MKNVISIVMATYNGANFINQQILSIINQSFCDFELIIVDDKSIDNTVQIINEFDDKRIKVIQNEKNIGCSATFFKGMSYAKGKYICLCDQDDVWELNKLDVLFRNIGCHDIIYSNNKIIDKYGEELDECNKYLNTLVGLDSKTTHFQKIALFNSFILGCSMMIRRETFNRVPITNDNQFNHDRWIVSMISQIGTVKYIENKLFSYRIHDNNHSISESLEKQTIVDRVKKYLYSPKFMPITYNNKTISIILNNDQYQNTFLSEYLKYSKFCKILPVIRYYRFLYLRLSFTGKIKAIIRYLIRD